MSVLRLLLNGAYRRARRAEGGGHYRRAAALYAEADAPEDAANALLFHAARSTSLDERLSAWRDALRWLPADNPRRAEVEGRIGQAILEDARRQGVLGARETERLTEAARRLERVGHWRDAAAAWQLLDRTEDAVRCLQSAGDVEQLEGLLERRGAEEARERQLRKLVSDYEMYWATGARREARDALRAAVDVAPDDESVVEPLRRLESRFPSGGRVELDVDGQRILLVGTLPAVLGRAEADVPLRGPSISRKHAEVGRSADGALRIRDLGSRNGTLVGGLPIEHEMSADSAIEIGLGEDLELRVEPVGPEEITLEVVRGVDRDLRVRLGPGSVRLPEVGAVVTFPEGHPTIRVDEGMELRLGAQVCAAPVSMLKGDVLTLGGQRVEVRR